MDALRDAEGSRPNRLVFEMGLSSRVHVALGQGCVPPIKEGYDYPSFFAEPEVHVRVMRLVREKPSEWVDEQLHAHLLAVSYSFIFFFMYSFVNIYLPSFFFAGHL